MELGWQIALRQLVIEQSGEDWRDEQDVSVGVKYMLLFSNEQRTDGGAVAPVSELSASYLDYALMNSSTDHSDMFEIMVAVFR